MRIQNVKAVVSRTSLLVVAFIMTSALSIGPITGKAVAAGCAVPLSADQSARATALNAYQEWKSIYVTENGAGGDLRVQRSSFDNYDTVSEGIAYGMLFSVYANDKTTFDGLWAYAQKHLNANGVMNWRIAADGATTGWNGATDADEDIAAALIAADTTWGGYRTAALKQVSAIKYSQIEAGSSVVKPGDAWGGSAQLNPSYIAPSYYDVFQAYTGDPSWATVKAVGYQVLQGGQNPTTGLFPDWSTSSGAAASGMGYTYGYDASRAPLRLALSAAWSCDQTATTLLAPFNTWFAGQNLTKLASSYTLEGAAIDRGDATPLLAATAAAASASQDAAYRTRSWNTLVNTPSTSYYPDSMRVFGLFVASGLMTSPATIPQQTPAPVVTAPKTLAVSGTNTTASVGVATDVQLTFIAPQQRNNMLIDIEVYDASGLRVAQQVYENKTLSQTGTTYTARWTPTSTGLYTVKAGIFTAGWASNLLWSEQAATVTVQPAAVITPVPTPTPIPTPAPTPPVILPVQPTTATVSIWWPGSTQPVAGVQPFKAVVDGIDVGQYEMFWQVDGGGLNKMDSVRDTAPHKLSLVDLKYWSWSSSGRYTINFVAKKPDGTIIGQKSTVITVIR